MVWITSSDPHQLTLRILAFDLTFYLTYMLAFYLAFDSLSDKYLDILLGSFVFDMTVYLTFYLAYVLTFYLTHTTGTVCCHSIRRYSSWHIFCTWFGILSHVWYAGVPSDILSGILTLYIWHFMCTWLDSPSGIVWWSQKSKGMFFFSFGRGKICIPILFWISLGDIIWYCGVQNFETFVFKLRDVVRQLRPHMERIAAKDTWVADVWNDGCVISTPLKFTWNANNEHGQSGVPRYVQGVYPFMK